MKIKTVVVKPYSKEESLLVSIIMFIIGIVLLTNPEGILEILSYSIGGILIISGIIKILIYKKQIKSGLGSTLDLIKSIIFILLGVICIVFFKAIETTFRIIVAAFILYMAINRLIFSISTRNKNKAYPVATVILSGISIIFAILLALIPGLSFSVIGLFIILYAFIEMAGYIIYRTKKGNTKDKNNINEAIIIKEIENKE